jgi:hypothetical protein
MSETEVGTAELRRSANEINWRHVWLTNVMIDTGKFGPPKIAHRRMPTGKSSLTRRLHKLRHMRAVLEPPKASGRC